MIDTHRLAESLTTRFGLGVEVSDREMPSGWQLTIYPSGIAPTISFRIEIHLGWRTINAKFVPGNFASELVDKMNSASESQKAAFSIFSDSLRRKGAKLDLKINSISCDPEDHTLWPLDWIHIEITMRKVGVITETDEGYNVNSVFPWASSFFGLITSLLPLEDSDTSEPNDDEGSRKAFQVKRFERSARNRAACIEIFGTSCQICSFDFRSIYGPLGEGFIHIHHITPLSEIGMRHQVNPKTDLIPVCPNCHAMLHRKTPALTPQELRFLLQQ